MLQIEKNYGKFYKGELITIYKRSGIMAILLYRTLINQVQFMETQAINSILCFPSITKQ
jgi:hypothetical protein